VIVEIREIQCFGDQEAGARGIELIDNIQVPVFYGVGGGSKIDRFIGTGKTRIADK